MNQAATEPFDTRGFDFEHFAEIKKDVLLFVELIT